MHLHNKYIVNIKSFIASGIVLKESFLRFYSNIAEQTHHIEFVPQHRLIYSSTFSHR